MSKFYILLKNISDSLLKEPIYEILDRYNQDYRLKPKDKKCKIFSTDMENLYIYLFPSIKYDDKILYQMKNQRIYNSNYTIKEDMNISVKELVINHECEKDNTSLITKENKLDYLTEDIGEFISLEDECSCIFDDLEKYTDRKRSIISKLTNRAKNMTEYNVAKLFKEVYSLLYICSSFERRIFHKFENHRWKKFDGGINIRKEISNGFLKNIYITYNTDPASTFDFEKLDYMLQHTAFKAKLYSEISELLYDETFLKTLDSKKHLIGFEDGVLDVNLLELRAGIPSDMISLSTSTYFNQTITEENQDMLNRLLNTIFPIEDIKYYMLRYIGSFLEAGNKDKIFSLWSGLGDNGKSIMVRLVELAFGEYAVKLPTSLLMGKRTQSASATPELALVENKLISIIQEPDDQEKMNLGLMKELTGNDTIYIREMYEKGKNIEVRSKVILIANKIPQLNTTDRATWSRIKVVPFLSTFVDDDKQLDEKRYIYKKDPNLINKLKVLVPAFFRLIIEEYKNYKIIGLDEPEIITKYTNELKELNDTLRQFLDGNTKEQKDAIVSVKELYECYKLWFKETYPGVKITNMSSFRQDIIKYGYIVNSLNQIYNLSLADLQF